MIGFEMRHSRVKRKTWTESKLLKVRRYSVHSLLQTKGGAEMKHPLCDLMGRECWVGSLQFGCKSFFCWVTLGKSRSSSLCRTGIVTSFSNWIIIILTERMNNCICCFGLPLSFFLVQLLCQGVSPLTYDTLGKLNQMSFMKWNGIKFYL